MWPFGSNTNRIQEAAASLDAAFSDALAKVSNAGVGGLRAWLATDQGATLVDDGSVANGTVCWRDQRIPNFMFWVDLNADPWSLHAICDGGRPPPSFIGISLNAGPNAGAPGSTSKAVSVEDSIRYRATPAAIQLGQVLSSRYNYRDLTKFLAAFGG